MDEDTPIVLTAETIAAMEAFKKQRQEARKKYQGLPLASEAGLTSDIHKITE